MCSEKEKAKSKRWREAHPDYQREYLSRPEVKERRRKRAREYYLKHCDEIIRKNLDYYCEHRDVRLEQMKAYNRRRKSGDMNESES